MSNTGNIDQPDQPESILDALDALGEIFRPIMQEREDTIEQVIAQINADYGIQLEIYTLACPVQIQGNLKGMYCYFRSRWSSWSFTIAANESDLWDTPLFKRDGDIDGDSLADASWLEAPETDRILRQCLDEYIAQASSTNPE